MNFALQVERKRQRANSRLGRWCSREEHIQPGELVLKLINYVRELNATMKKTVKNDNLELNSEIGFTREPRSSSHVNRTSGADKNMKSEVNNEKNENREDIKG